ncbi:MAG: transglycosylase SLT domain-containing protein [Bdellovibrionales bacterium]
MKIHQHHLVLPLGLCLAVGAQLALMAVISLALTTNDPQPDATDLLIQEIAAATSAPPSNASPSPEPKKNPQEIALPKLVPTKMDETIAVLSVRDAALYRAIFDSHKQAKWEYARDLFRLIKDRRLVGIVLADRFQRLGATVAEQKVWLETFPDLPEAKAIHAAAQKSGATDLPSLPELKAWSSGHVIDSATSFMSEQDLQKTAENDTNLQLALSLKQKIAQGQPESALEMLDSACKKQSLSKDFLAEAQALIAASFFRSGNIEQATELSGSAAQQNQPLGLWIRGLVAWQNKNYRTARTLFTRLADQNTLNDSNDAAAHFWAYRASVETGDNDEGETHLRQAAHHPKTLYGLLAGHLLDQDPFKASHEEIPHWNKTYHAILAKIPAGWRALALLQIGQNKRAEAELRHINPHGSTQKQDAMLALTSLAPMPSLTLKLASLKKKKDYQDAFYPLLPWQPINGFDVDRALLFALARHESHFNPKAISRRGARGLMQIMPATARYIAKTENMKELYYKADNLFDPALNMTLGQSYVRQLSNMPHIGNNLLLLLAAYNGGPGKAMNWVQKIDTKDPLLFLESIPTRETRQYIARVLPHYWAYRARLGKPLDTLEALAKGLWPTATLADDPQVRVADASNS